MNLRRFAEYILFNNDGITRKLPKPSIDGIPFYSQEPHPLDKKDRITDGPRITSGNFKKWRGSTLVGLFDKRYFIGTKGSTTNQSIRLTTTYTIQNLYVVMYFIQLPLSKGPWLIFISVYYTEHIAIKSGRLNRVRIISHFNLRIMFGQKQSSFPGNLKMGYQLIWLVDNRKEAFIY